MSDVRVVFSTISTRDLAESISLTLVEECLASCVNIIPSILSIYRWKGAIEQESETLMIIKTASDRLDALMQRLEELHPYEVPEIVALEIEGGHGPYLEWIVAETRGSGSK